MFKKIITSLLVIFSFFIIYTPPVFAKNTGGVNSAGNYYYYGTNGKYTGWHWMTAKEGEKTDHWSYFGKDGVLRTGWQWLDPKDGEKKAHWSYFGNNGWLKTGWVQLGKGTANPDGNSTKHWSYFGGNGWLRTYWVQFGKGTTEPDDNSARHWSYFGSNGWLRTGLQEMGTAQNPDNGCAVHLSYFDSKGWLSTNTKVSVNNTKFTADDRGWLTGVKTISMTPVANNKKTISKKAQELKDWFWKETLNPTGDQVYYPEDVSYSVYEEATTALSEERFAYLEGLFTGWNHSQKVYINPVLTKEYYQKNEYIKNTIEKIAGSVFGKGMTETEAVRAIDRWFKNNWRYKNNNNNLYTGLTNSGGTCTAYAQLAQALCDRIGMDCLYVSGKTSNGGLHAWNRVRVNYRWYYVDFTWNDNSDDYYLSENLWSDHFADREESYFIENN